MSTPGPDDPPKVTIFGRTFHILSEEALLEETEGTGKHAIACIRVADLQPEDDLVWASVKARRLIVKCARCREKVWFDPRSSPYPPGAVRICLVCLKELGPKGLDPFLDGT